jgi:hypothetical protein
MRGMKTAGIRFLRAVSGYRMTDPKHKENIKELGIADKNSIIKV